MEVSAEVPSMGQINVLKLFVLDRNKCKSQRILCVSFSRTDSGLYINYLLVRLNFNFLHSFQWIIFPTQSFSKYITFGDTILNISSILLFSSTMTLSFKTVLLTGLRIRRQYRLERIKNQSKRSPQWVE